MVWQTTWVVSGKSTKDEQLELLSNGLFMNQKSYLIPPGVGELNVIVARCDADNVNVKLTLRINGNVVWTEIKQSGNDKIAIFNPKISLTIYEGKRLSVQGNAIECYLYSGKNDINLNAFFEFKFKGTSIAETILTDRSTGQFILYGGYYVPYYPVVVDTNLTGMVVMMQNPGEWIQQIVLQVYVGHVKEDGSVWPVEGPGASSSPVRVDLGGGGAKYVILSGGGLKVKAGQCVFVMGMNGTTLKYKFRSGKDSYWIHLMGTAAK